MMTNEALREEALAHFGVKGMKWGVRRSVDKLIGRPDEIEKIGFDRIVEARNKVSRHLRYDKAWERDRDNLRKVEAEVEAEREAARAKLKAEQPISRKVDREARKDAQEFARAKMFYGDGAGNRRKLIKATVEGKGKKDPQYKEAFEKHLSDQDMSEHASKAKGERKRKNAVNSTAKTARGIRNVLNGNSKYASLAAATMVGGYMYARKAGIDKVVFNAAKRTISEVRRSGALRKGTLTAAQFLGKR